VEEVAAARRSLLLLLNSPMCLIDCALESKWNNLRFPLPVAASSVSELSLSNSDTGRTGVSGTDWRNAA